MIYIFDFFKWFYDKDITVFLMVLLFTFLTLVVVVGWVYETINNIMFFLSPVKTGFATVKGKTYICLIEQEVLLYTPSIPLLSPTFFDSEDVCSVHLQMEKGEKGEFYIRRFNDYLFESGQVICIQYKENRLFNTFKVIAIC